MDLPDISEDYPPVPEDRRGKQAALAEAIRELSNGLGSMGRWQCEEVQKAVESISDWGIMRHLGWTGGRASDPAFAEATLMIKAYRDLETVIAVVERWLAARELIKVKTSRVILMRFARVVQLTQALGPDAMVADSELRLS